MLGGRGQVIACRGGGDEHLCAGEQEERWISEGGQVSACRGQVGV